ncbi:hypothetical protein ILUMI_04228 [Ignelater luminosus]|uniref:Uncharacterized protein n=1 Tax=Ignelater luminosus TaxID=2038154 RepID=A0A8K0DEQ9_IGNLU|nr:hypothetical protein ILUMI_04228 [Ignelater luminosus]
MTNPNFLGCLIDAPEPLLEPFRTSFKKPDSPLSLDVEFLLLKATTSREDKTPSAVGLALIRSVFGGDARQSTTGSDINQTTEAVRERDGLAYGIKTLFQLHLSTSNESTTPLGHDNRQLSTPTTIIIIINQPEPPTPPTLPCPTQHNHPPTTALMENAMGWVIASKRFNEPQATLRHHYQHVPVNPGRYKPTFDPEIECNPNMSLRAPEPTSAARAREFNRPQVMREDKAPKRLAQKQDGVISSAERNEHVTVAVCVNAIGNFVPSALIIPKKNYKTEYSDGAPPRTLELCYATQWMRTVGFYQVAQIFGRAYDKSEIYPFNAEEVFLLSEVTENNINKDQIDIVHRCSGKHCSKR